MRRFLPALVIYAFLLGCGDGEVNDDAYDNSGAAADTSLPGPDSPHPPDSARADMIDASGRGLGAVILTQGPNGILLSGALIGLSPGEHGFHVHQTGACEPPTFESAESHLAGGSDAHGFDAEGGPHAGDLRNLVAADDSTATIDQSNARLSLRNGDTALLDGDGSAIVVHAGPDDYRSQPSGASGDPIACGVIEG